MLHNVRALLDKMNWGAEASRGREEIAQLQLHVLISPKASSASERYDTCRAERLRNPSQRWTLSR